MSTPSQVKRYVKFVRPDKNVNDITFQLKKDEENNQSKSTKALRSHSKSPSISKSYMKSKSLNDEICELLESAKFAKDKINKGLEFVKLVDNFNQEQRCLEHNNVITLYCTHDKKLLCVYCIYGVNKHRSHKLLPPFEHLDYIAKDVYDLQHNFNQFLFSLEDVVTNSKLTCELFQNIMKKHLGQIEVEYVKRKLELQQLYESQKNYITKVCEKLIQNSKLISNQYEEIKFNIWQCQARYNLDKRLNFANPNPKEASFLEKQLNQKNTKSKQNKQGQTQGGLVKKDISPSKQHTKNETKQMNQRQTKKEYIKSDGIEDSQKDYRQVLSKHIILNHVVEEMRKIQPIKIDEKTIERKMFNRSMLKLIPHANSDSDKTSFKNDSRSSRSISKLK